MAAAALRVLEARARAFAPRWRSATAAAVLTPVAFLAAMGLGLGTLVDRGGAELAGGSYLAYLAPGLLAATAMQTGVGESAWPIRLGVSWQKTYLATLATPVSTGDLLLGHLLWVALRLLAAAVAIAVGMVAFGATGVAGAARAVAPAVLTGMAFAAPMAAWAVLMEKNTTMVTLFRFGVTPLFLFSGAFFPVSQLPGALEALAVVTPLWHGVELTRSAALSLPPSLPAALHVAYLVVWVVAGTAVARWAFARRLIS